MLKYIIIFILLPIIVAANSTEVKIKAGTIHSSLNDEFSNNQMLLSGIITYKSNFPVFPIIYMGIDNYSIHKEIFVHIPIRTNYIVGAKYNIRKLSVGIEHACNHPVYSNYGNFWEYNKWISEYTEVYIEYTIN